MHDTYFYDGRFVRGDEGVVRLEDRGYQFGDGVYDAWMVYEGRQFLRDEHLDRLERSCAAIGIAPCYSRSEVEAFTDEMVERSGAERGMIYLQWTRGWQSPRSHVAAPGLRSILSGCIRETHPYPDEYFSKGVGTIFFPDDRQRYCDIKSLNLLGSVMASNAARAALCHEALFVREEGGRRFVTECAHSNCYAVKDGAIYTAPLGKLILPGVTRQVVLGLARDLGHRGRRGIPRARILLRGRRGLHLGGERNTARRDDRRRAVGPGARARASRPRAGLLGALDSAANGERRTRRHEGWNAERRLVELETKASFQEATLSDLNKAIIEQGARIEKLEATVRALRERIKEASGEGQSPLPENERPPHY